MKKTKTRKPKEKMVEIAASWSFKLNLANYMNPQEMEHLDRIDSRVMYQSQDWFLSQKKVCAAGKETETYEAIENFCRTSIMKSVNRYIAEAKVLATPEKPAQTKIKSGIVESVPGRFMN